MANSKAWQDLTQALKSGQMKPLGNLYEMHRQEFLVFIKKYSLTNSEEIDIYQDSILALYENVVRDKVTKYNASIKTYLFSIGKYKALNVLKQRAKTVDFNQSHDSQELIYDHRNLFEEKEPSVVNKALGALGKICRELLVMSYYQGMKNEILLSKFAYKNDQTLRANKSRCLKKLREQVKNLQAHL